MKKRSVVTPTGLGVYLNCACWYVRKLMQKAGVRGRRKGPKMIVSEAEVPAVLTAWHEARILEPHPKFQTVVKRAALRERAD